MQHQFITTRVRVSYANVLDETAIGMARASRQSYGKELPCTCGRYLRLLLHVHTKEAF